MILFLGVIVFALVVGLVAGGSLRRFTDLRLRWWLLAPVGFALQEIPLPDGRNGDDLVIRMVVFGVSYALVLAFAVRNWRITAMPLIVLGLLLNGLVVTANGGMPVSRTALLASEQPRELRLLLEDEGAKHHLLRPGEDVLAPLGDVIAVPPPIAVIVSVGDLFVYVGLIWMLIAIMRGQTRGLDRAQEPYRGRHRRTALAKVRARSIAPAPTTTWGTGP